MSVICSCVIILGYFFSVLHNFSSVHSRVGIMNYTCDLDSVEPLMGCFLFSVDADVWSLMLLHDLMGTFLGV